MEVDGAELVYAAFRLVTATVLTGTAGYVSVRLIQRALKPLSVWLYVAVILWIVTAFRWLVVWLRATQPDGSVVDPWIQPLTQTMTVLLAIAILVLTTTHIRQRRIHYETHHRAATILLTQMQDHQATHVADEEQRDG